MTKYDGRTFDVVALVTFHDKRAESCREIRELSRCILAGSRVGVVGHVGIVDDGQFYVVRLNVVGYFLYVGVSRCVAERGDETDVHRVVFVPFVLFLFASFAAWIVVVVAAATGCHHHAAHEQHQYIQNIFLHSFHPPSFI